MVDELKNLSDIPAGGFIPEHLSPWAEIEVFLPDVPAVELNLTQNGKLQGEIIIDNITDLEGDEKQRYYADALYVVQSDKTEICIFDAAKHGWDAVECDSHFKQNTERLNVKCRSCGTDRFQPRISWLGYQVFDEGPPSVEGSIEFRNSFDSIGIDILCLSCGNNENILSAETA